MKEFKRYAVTGIGTDVGKTVVSAILSEALEAHYWKPVQAGDLNFSDTKKVQKYCSNKVRVMQERFALSEPMSPHAAAEVDGVNITLSDFKVPDVEANLIVEGAGGLMVPFNANADTYLDLFKHFNLPTIIVSRHYLGSINHTMMTIELMQREGIEIAGIIYVGEEHKTTESIIAKKYDIPVIYRVPLAKEITPNFIQEQAQIIKEKL